MNRRVFELLLCVILFLAGFCRSSLNAHTAIGSSGIAPGQEAFHLFESHYDATAPCRSEHTFPRIQNGSSKALLEPSCSLEIKGLYNACPTWGLLIGPDRRGELSPGIDRCNNVEHHYDPESFLIDLGRCAYLGITLSHWIEVRIWLSPDPAGFVDGPNLYAYVRNNPWSAFDPHGLEMEIFHPDGRHATVPENTSVFVWTDANGQTQMAAIARDPMGRLYYDTSGKIESYRRAMGAKRFGQQMAAGGYTLATLLPIIGEGDDALTAADESNPGWVRTVAGVSLTVSGVTYGLSPNFGKWAKGLSDFFGVTKHADEIIDSADEVFDLVGVTDEAQAASKIVDQAPTPGNWSLSDFGNTIAGDSQALKHYQEMQDLGFDVRIIDDPLGEVGQTIVDSSGMWVDVNRSFNRTIQDAMNTFFHESKHVSIFGNTGLLYGARGKVKGEYMARAREFYYSKGRRPALEERIEIKIEMRINGYYD